MFLSTIRALSMSYPLAESSTTGWFRTETTWFFQLSGDPSVRGPSCRWHAVGVASFARVLSGALVMTHHLFHREFHTTAPPIEMAKGGK